MASPYLEIIKARPAIRSNVISQRTKRSDKSDRDDLLMKVPAEGNKQTPHERTVSIRNDMAFTQDGKSECSFERCHKKHHHNGFIPISELKLDDLPIGNNSLESLTYIRCLSHVTVKVTVHHVSKGRQHQFSGFENSSLTRQGTGWVSRVSLDDDIETIPCTAPNCTIKTSHDVFGPVLVITANHLVYDKSEAEATTIQFTDDVSEDNSMLSWTGHGVDIAYTENVERDFVFVKCYFHKLDIIAQLEPITQNIVKLMDTLYHCDEERAKDDQTFGFIISHPHGLGKHVSFGKCYGKLEKEEAQVIERELEFDMETGEKRAGLVKYTYDIPTCPGSSGAPVCIMGRDRAYHYLAPHSCVDGGEMGCSEVFVERKNLDTKIYLYYPYSDDVISPLSKKLSSVLFIS